MGSEGPVVFWKGLKMSRKCLGVPRGCSCGSGGSWSHPEGSGGVPERPCRVQRVLLLIHGVRRFIQKGLELSRTDLVGSRGSPGVPRASLQSSSRVWGCFREDLECLGGPWVGSVVFWKGLKMSQECLGVSKVCSCGSGGSWSHPEGSGDVAERTGRVWAVLRWVQRVLLSSGRV